MKTLGIDIGNFAVKTSSGFYVQSKIKKGCSIFNENGISLKYKNEDFIIGNGNYETETVKTKKENLYPLIITAICKSFKEDMINTNIAIGLPLNQYKNMKKELRNNILENYKNLTVEIDRKIKIVTINNVVIVPEGVGALYAIPSNEKVDKNNVVVADIGGLTTNIFELEDGTIKNDLTLDIGMLQLYNQLYAEIKKDYVDLKLSYDKLEDILVKGYFLYFGEVISAKKYIQILSPSIKEVYNTLKMKYSIESNSVVLLGGGSKHFYPIIHEKIKHSIAIDDVFANANGFKIIGDNVFKS